MLCSILVIVNPDGSLALPEAPLLFLVDGPISFVGEAGRDRLRGVAVAVLGIVLPYPDDWRDKFGGPLCGAYRLLLPSASRLGVENDWRNGREWLSPGT